MANKDTKPSDPPADPQVPPVEPPKDDTPRGDDPKDEKEFKRPDAIYFVGELRPDGEPVEHLAGYGINAADYPPSDPMLARLTDDQLKLALDSGLYRRTKPADKTEG